MNKLRILIADDHEIVRRGMRSFFKAQPDWEVCGEASNGREAVELVLKIKPDIVVLDITMPELNGLEATLQIKQSCPETEVLVFTGLESEVLIHQLFVAGARAFVLKQDVAGQIVPAIRALAEHRPYFGTQISMVVFEQYFKNGISPNEISPDGLTAREREIIQLLAEGKANKDVGDILGISVKTAETHRAAIMRKLNLNAFSDLVRFAIRNHIIDA